MGEVQAGTVSNILPEGAVSSLSTGAACKAATMAWLKTVLDESAEYAGVRQHMVPLLQAAQAALAQSSVDDSCNQPEQVLHKVVQDAMRERVTQMEELQRAAALIVLQMCEDIHDLLSHHHPAAYHRLRYALCQLFKAANEKCRGADDDQLSTCMMVVTEVLKQAVHTAAEAGPQPACSTAASPGSKLQQDQASCQQPTTNSLGRPTSNSQAAAEQLEAGPSAWHRLLTAAQQLDCPDKLMTEPSGSCEQLAPFNVTYNADTEYEKSLREAWGKLAFALKLVLRSDAPHSLPKADLAAATTCCVSRAQQPASQGATAGSAMRSSPVHSGSQVQDNSVDEELSDYAFRAATCASGQQRSPALPYNKGATKAAVGAGLVGTAVHSSAGAVAAISVLPTSHVGTLQNVHGKPLAGSKKLSIHLKRPLPSMPLDTAMDSALDQLQDTGANVLGDSMTAGTASAAETDRAQVVHGTVPPGKGPAAEQVCLHTHAAGTAPALALTQPAPGAVLPQSASAAADKTVAEVKQVLLHLLEQAEDATCLLQQVAANKLCTHIRNLTSFPGQAYQLDSLNDAAACAKQVMASFSTSELNRMHAVISGCRKSTATVAQPQQAGAPVSPLSLNPPLQHVPLQPQPQLQQEQQALQLQQAMQALESSRMHVLRQQQLAALEVQCLLAAQPAAQPWGADLLRQVAQASAQQLRAGAQQPLQAVCNMLQRSKLQQQIKKSNKKQARAGDPTSSTRVLRLPDTCHAASTLVVTPAQASVSRSSSEAGAATQSLAQAVMGLPAVDLTNVGSQHAPRSEKSGLAVLAHAAVDSTTGAQQPDVAQYMEAARCLVEVNKLSALMEMLQRAATPEKNASAPTVLPPGVKRLRTGLQPSGTGSMHTVPSDRSRQSNEQARAQDGNAQPAPTASTGTPLQTAAAAVAEQQPKAAARASDRQGAAVAAASQHPPAVRVPHFLAVQHAASGAQLQSAMADVQPLSASHADVQGTNGHANTNASVAAPSVHTTATSSVPSPTSNADVAGAAPTSTRQHEQSEAAPANHAMATHSSAAATAGTTVAVAAAVAPAPEPVTSNHAETQEPSTAALGNTGHKLTDTLAASEAGAAAGTAAGPAAVEKAAEQRTVPMAAAVGSGSGMAGHGQQQTASEVGANSCGVGQAGAAPATATMPTDALVVPAAAPAAAAASLQQAGQHLSVPVSAGTGDAPAADTASAAAPAKPPVRRRHVNQRNLAAGSQAAVAQVGSPANAGYLPPAKKAAAHNHAAPNNGAVATTASAVVGNPPAAVAASSRESVDKTAKTPCTHAAVETAADLATAAAETHRSNSQAVAGSTASGVHVAGLSPRDAAIKPSPSASTLSQPNQECVVPSNNLSDATKKQLKNMLQFAASRFGSDKTAAAGAQKAGISSGALQKDKSATAAATASTAQVPAPMVASNPIAASKALATDGSKGGSTAAPGKAPQQDITNATASNKVQATEAQQQAASVKSVEQDVTAKVASSDKGKPASSKGMAAAAMMPVAEGSRTSGVSPSRTKTAKMTQAASAGANEASLGSARAAEGAAVVDSTQQQAASGSAAQPKQPKGNTAPAASRQHDGKAAGDVTPADKLQEKPAAPVEHALSLKPATHGKATSLTEPTKAVASTGQDKAVSSTQQGESGRAQALQASGGPSATAEAKGTAAGNRSQQPQISHAAAAGAARSQHVSPTASGTKRKEPSAEPSDAVKKTKKPAASSGRSAMSGEPENKTLALERWLRRKEENKAKKHAAVPKHSKGTEAGAADRQADATAQSTAAGQPKQPTVLPQDEASAALKRKHSSGPGQLPVDHCTGAGSAQAAPKSQDTVKAAAAVMPTAAHDTSTITQRQQQQHAQPSSAALPPPTESAQALTGSAAASPDQPPITKRSKQAQSGTDKSGSASGSQQPAKAVQPTCSMPAPSGAMLQQPDVAPLPHTASTAHEAQQQQPSQVQTTPAGVGQQPASGALGPPQPVPSVWHQLQAHPAWQQAVSTAVDKLSAVLSQPNFSSVQRRLPNGSIVYPAQALWQGLDEGVGAALKHLHKQTHNDATLPAVKELVQVLRSNYRARLEDVVPPVMTEQQWDEFEPEELRGGDWIWAALTLRQVGDAIMARAAKSMQPQLEDLQGFASVLMALHLHL